MSENPDVEVIAAGRFLQFVRRGGWEYVDRTNVSGIVCIAALTAQREMVLVEQYRPPIAKHVIEMPAGLAGDVAGHEDEPLVRAAQRELLEETGYRATQMTEICRGVPSAGLSTEELTIFVARDVERVGDGGGDESESIRVHVVPLDGVADWLADQQRAGKAVDLKIYIGLWALGERL